MKEWEFDMAEVNLLGSYNTEYIGKAYQKKMVEWLLKNGGHFWGKVKGHCGFYELEWDKFEELLDDLGVGK